MNKIYEYNSYVTSCEAVVSSCKTEQEQIWIQLSDSVFFPEGGGQYADTGEILVGERKIQVLDGQVTDGEVWYQVSEILEAGTKVVCQLNWEQRYMRMQQHSGEHIIMGVIHNKFKLENVGFHLSDTEPVTLMLNGSLSREQIRQVERMANQIIYANMPITISFPTDEELKTLTYRSKIEIQGQVRITAIGNEKETIDVCACCAPHVDRTGEVGIIKVVSVQNVKDGVKVGILCGKRAWEYYDEQLSYMQAAANQLSTSPDQVSRIIEKQKQEIIDLKNQIGQMAEKMVLKEVEALGGVAHGCVFTEEILAMGPLKSVYNAMTEKISGYSGIFMGDDENGYRYCAGSRQLDSRELAKMMREALGCKGGGSAEMVQGKVMAKKEAIQSFFDGLVQ